MLVIYNWKQQSQHDKYPLPSLSQDWKEKGHDRAYNPKKNEKVKQTAAEYK